MKKNPKLNIKKCTNLFVVPIKHFLKIEQCNSQIKNQNQILDVELAQSSPDSAQAQRETHTMKQNSVVSQFSHSERSRKEIENNTVID